MTCVGCDELKVRKIAAKPARVSKKGLVDLVTEIGVRDGRGAFNPWLRELPEPLTKTSWVATARIAPETAKAAWRSAGRSSAAAGYPGVEQAG